MKSAQDYLDEANAVVPKMDASEAIKHHGDANAVFIDVRDSGEIAQSGTIQGAKRVNRGFIEFAADPQMEKFHKDFFQKDKQFYLMCAAGGQAALAGKTLKDMGYENVTNIGGFSGWKDAGGPTEAG